MRLLRGRIPRTTARTRGLKPAEDRGQLCLPKTPSPQLGGLSALPRVPMVESANAKKRDDLPVLSRLHRSCDGGVLVQAKVGPILVEIIHVGSDQAPKLALVDGDDVVQAIAP